MWHDWYACLVGSRNQLASGIGDGRAARFTYQASIPASQEWRNQTGDLVRRGMFIQLADFDFLDRPNQRQSLQEGSSAASILRNQIIEACCQFDQRGAELSDGIARSRLADGYRDEMQCSR
jgi:hypothetical protein